MTNVRSNESVLCEVLELKGLRIVDIGSGAGELVRYMTRQGASVTGLECGALQLEKARSYPSAGDEIYVEGFGQEMPFDDATYDLVIFFNSLHHVPVDHMAGALGEAVRVVRPGGTVYVAEPIAAGSGFELHAPIDDETSVRSAAYGVIRGAAGHGLIEVREIFYDTTYHHENFAAFKEEMIRIEPRRRVLFEANEAELTRAFDRLGVPEEMGIRFDQPMRVNVLEKA
ncbi:MAG: class I SAM-dependent methyltransferase [Gammaproteobacteria bacterium]|nr:class I SAM-dependent methyltransferase [Gammaproteobacteria bacterium]MCZ6667690.1 class I SAM-dependent methyltransferase [Gammaproteobacteria bacterium]MCZ6797430.1 class I SAM-dependent methyltransferase [Gammaproteobacteria bacterium]